MTPITLYTANCRGDRFNTVYPNKIVVETLDDLRNAVSYDQVFAEYKDGHRSIADFVSADCIPFDCDNDHGNLDTDWITPKDVAESFPGVPFYVIYSRHHMKDKGKYSPRPRFHVIFPIDTITDSEEYRKLKEAVLRHFPFFDDGAKDAARFFFGVKKPVIELFGGDVDEAE